ncbi:MAG TPA: phytanoyl-CoA dioxygenase family protein [Bryobacteraceae bacterium]|nr:phytanoyl-CoA dioxygenase family protein [Bryobacteraceae bacterium]
MTEDQKTYAESGYLVMGQAFSGDKLTSLLGTLCQRLSNAVTGSDSVDELVMAAEAENHKIVYEAAQSVGSAASTYRLLGDGGFLDNVCQITGFRESELHIMPLYLIIQLPSDERFDYGWHQDRAYYDWCDEMATIWLPVNRPATATTGTISVIPGSHRKSARESETYLRSGFFRQIEARVEPDEAAAHKVLELNPGECCIMNGDLVHRSIANRSSSPRIAGVVRLANVPAKMRYERERFFCVHKS